MATTATGRAVWLSQVEGQTFAAPAVPLWASPQITFNEFNGLTNGSSDRNPLRIEARPTTKVVVVAPIVATASAPTAHSPTGRVGQGGGKIEEWMGDAIAGEADDGQEFDAQFSMDDERTNPGLDQGDFEMDDSYFQIAGHLEP